MIGGLLRRGARARAAPRAARRAAFRRFQKRVDHSEYGGAPLLGVAGLARGRPRPLVAQGRAQRHRDGLPLRVGGLSSTGSSRKSSVHGSLTPVIAFIFPGQGSQTVGMGKALADTFDVCRETFAEADAALGEPLSRLCFEGPEDQLRLTENTQPAILTVSVAAYRLLASRGFQPDVRRRPQPGRVLGARGRRHDQLRRRGARRSAAAAATCRRPCRWARARWPPCSASTPARWRAACEEAAEGQVVSPANLNMPGQVVIAGARDAVARAVASGRRRSAPGGSFRCR